MLYTVDKELNTAQTYANTYEDFLDMLQQQKKLDITRIPTDETGVSKRCAMVDEADATLPEPYSLDDDLSFEQKKSILWNFLNLYRKSVDLRYESSISPNAIPLVEEFAAFSDSIPLNAIHVISCIFLVVVDSKSKTTLGAHINSRISAESITKVISAFLTELNIPKDEQKDYSLVCHLVGGNCETKELGTLKNIYESLSQFNIQLERSLVSDLMCGGQVDNISYNPETATFHEAMLPTDNADRSVQEIYVAFEDARLKPREDLLVYSSHIKSHYKCNVSALTKEVMMEKPFQKYLDEFIIEACENLSMLRFTPHIEEVVCALNPLNNLRLVMAQVMTPKEERSSTMAQVHIQYAAVNKSSEEEVLKRNSSSDTFTFKNNGL